MLKNALRLITNFFEIYVPIGAFFVMFGTFLLQVFFRYVLRSPLTWTQEVIVLSFVWVVIFGASYTMREKGHVKFTMVYDMAPPRVAALLRFAGNALIASALFLLIVPSFKYALFVGFQRTAVFRVSYTVAFLPFLYLLISSICYIVPELYEDIRVMRGDIEDSSDHAVSEIIRESVEASQNIDATEIFR
ncbi:TRAP-type C4-dicarboxylate transport system, small permease component [Alkalispirochaeta americana]|uniref:TRAP-type C4-dicarboxylate transport system, small permease component n=1 Tax=Alkalispirochaeta americana TaxID=159291 RepID=A0A1N6UTT4_9SPIO|nr:TRAP transporter small permease [Alkalispirochaeta americana]SIQ69040.1 TRAP-type C4-dicarboxylate transport system, small permease component [Alkalispirochaeta americana]